MPNQTELNLRTQRRTQRFFGTQTGIPEKALVIYQDFRETVKIYNQSPELLGPATAGVLGLIKAFSAMKLWEATFRSAFWVATHTQKSKELTTAADYLVKSATNLSIQDPAKQAHFVRLFKHFPIRYRLGIQNPEGVFGLRGLGNPPDLQCYVTCQNKKWVWSPDMTKI